jgi:hypothetical protein
MEIGVWEYCAKSELHPRSGLEMLKGRKTIRLDFNGISGSNNAFCRPFKADRFCIRTRG